jgi:hypothetical protein
MAAIRKIGPFTTSVLAMFSRQGEMHTPVWDREIAHLQSMAHVTERGRIFRKKTPRLGGRLRPGRR